MQVDPTRIRIKDDLYYIDNPESFLWIVEEKLGQDACNYLKELLDATPSGCTGECENTYKIQEHYERVIEDALDELNGAVGKSTASDIKIQAALKILYAEI